MKFIKKLIVFLNNLTSGNLLLCFIFSTCLANASEPVELTVEINYLERRRVFKFGKELPDKKKYVISHFFLTKVKKSYISDKYFLELKNKILLLNSSLDIDSCKKNKITFRLGSESKPLKSLCIGSKDGKQIYSYFHSLLNTSHSF